MPHLINNDNQGQKMANYISSINSPSLVFFTPRQGKPGLRSSSSASEESRGLVRQLSQKDGSNCLYYALNTIRPRIGKNPPKNLEREREIEVIISQRRKLRSKHLPDVTHMRDFAYQAFSAGCSTRIEAQNLLTNIDTMLASDIPPRQRETAIEALTDFVKQKEYDNFIDYTKSLILKKEIAINKWFLKQFKIDSDKILATVKADGKGKTGKSQTSLSTLMDQDRVLERFAVNTQFEQYKLKKSSWHPSLPISSLMQQLREKGPHVVSGLIGQPYYIDKPHKVEEIQGKPIFGWKPGSKTQSCSETHCVTIIGARKKGNNERVYFIDPWDGSNPQKPEQQKIYTMSYKNFVGKTVTWDSRQYREQIGGEQTGEIGTDDFNASGENNYGVHAGRALESSSTSSSASSSSSSISSSTASSLSGSFSSLSLS